MQPLALSQLCSPRESTFAVSRSETVAEIADLAKLEAISFFRETHVTEGMHVLLRQVFERLMGRSDQGVFRLKQAMGGGKTHICQAATGGVATGKMLVLRTRKRTQTTQLCAQCIGCGNIRLPIVISGGNSSSCSTSIAATIAGSAFPKKAKPIAIDDSRPRFEHAGIHFRTHLRP
jgi:hypothetical protein